MKRMLAVSALSLVALAGCGQNLEERSEQVQSELTSFNCEWETQKSDESAVLSRCDGESLILMTGSDKSVSRFVEELREDSGIDGRVLIGKGYALVTESQTPAEQARDDLGGGEIVSID